MAAGSTPPRRGSSCSPTGYRSCPNASRRLPRRQRRPLSRSASPSWSRRRRRARTRRRRAASRSICDDEEAVRSAVERIGAPVIVQPMISGGTELLAGLVQDPVFGPLVAFGPGGVLAELIGEASFRIAPLTDVDAEELVSEGKAGRLVRGFRGAPAADVSALVDLVHRLSRLGLDVPAVAELDLNPVLGLARSVCGCRRSGAHRTPRRSTSRRRAGSAIFASAPPTRVDVGA